MLTPRAVRKKVHKFMTVRQLNAYEAGVSVTNPQMRRAAALLSALEAASATAESDDTNTVVGPDAGLDEKLDALFGGFAPPPDLEL